MINTLDDLQKVLSEIKFVNTVLDFNWVFSIKPICVKDKAACLIWVNFDRPDSITGKLSTGRGRDEIIWQGSSVSSVVKTAWLLIELVVRHELMEGFRWRGARIFNPHNTVEDLAELQLKHEIKK